MKANKHQTLQTTCWLPNPPPPPSDFRGQNHGSNENTGGRSVHQTVQHNVVLCNLFVLHVVFLFQLVGRFIARAVSDQILSKGYIEGYKGKVDCEYTRYVTGKQSSAACD